MDETLNTIQQGDCIAGMSQLAPESIDLAFADPPFNIGYEYDVYKDKLGREKYLEWSREWIGGVHRVLKPDGTFWLAIGDEYAAELKILSQEVGFHTRSWVVWYYTFGVNCKYKFTRSHAHLFYFVKDPDNFTFRSEDLENRIPSARELVYNDKRANPKGRLPDDTWMIRPADVVGEIMADDGTWSPEDIKPERDTDRTYILRPQDIENCFQADENTWYFPRVAGTFKERQGFHGCQMPEQLLGRIVRSCSNEGDLVLDPFSGSATTLAVAKKLNRKYVGFELSDDYVDYGRDRLSQIRIGDRLDGSAEPTKSAPKTGAKPNSIRDKKVTKAQKQLFAYEEQLAATQLELTLNGVAEAFRICHDGFSVDRVVLDPAANELFQDVCRRLGLAGDPRTWNTLLFKLRKSGKLSNIEITQQTEFSWEEVDPYFHASEMALQSLLNDERATDITEIFCDPLIAQEFDKLAKLYSPGRTSLEYRWAALMLDQHSSKARTRGAMLKAPGKFGKLTHLQELTLDDIPTTSGVYLLQKSKKTNLYAGETLNLQQRLTSLQEAAVTGSDPGKNLQVRFFPTQTTPADMLSWQSCFIKKHQPKLNYQELSAV
ncbi:DNA methyltransferase [Planctomicrobium sp.]|jgi:DNA modification methylase|nr:site-specific DNA-methyltransferase [Planctomicrobium sp.]MDB4439905.1 DNA methyltransferase [Planctomicrobium sp.]